MRVCDTRRKSWLHCDAEECRRCRKAHHCACLRARQHHITNAKWGWESPRRKRIQANSTRDGGEGGGGWDALFVLFDKSKRSQTGITVHNTCTKTHEIETFFFLKKGCTSAPCSMQHLKLTLQVLQLQPLATHRDVASGYRQEVAQSPSLSQPHHWYCTPVAKAMTTKCLVFWPHSPEHCNEKVWHMQSSQTCLQLWMQDPLCHKSEKGTTTTT